MILISRFALNRMCKELVFCLLVVSLQLICYLFVGVHVNRICKELVLFCLFVVSLQLICYLFVGVHVKLIVTCRQNKQNAKEQNAQT